MFSNQPHKDQIGKRVQREAIASVKYPEAKRNVTLSRNFKDQCRKKEGAILKESNQADLWS